MKLVYTEQALASLQECLDFFPSEVPKEKILKIRDEILSRADRILMNPGSGQKEEYLAHLSHSHRRVITGHYKIIYRIEGEVVFITDIFDSRQDPEKMKS